MYVFLVNMISDLCPVLVMNMLYAILCYTSPSYSELLLYIFITVVKYAVYDIESFWHT